LGDLLFSLVNLARHLQLEPELLLNAASDKFGRRFRAVEKRVAAQGKTMKACTPEELDGAWREVKAKEAE
jgi:ATP diphosphatase